ncbi:hypothetical protein, partial [Vibrio hangzhouensis]|uniref:hypothetical protein n=1 Tax=Vibrio hangzhouensis TaxID=462991 RepID=UPI001ABF2759
PKSGCCSRQQNSQNGMVNAQSPPTIPITRNSLRTIFRLQPRVRQKQVRPTLTSQIILMVPGTFFAKWH